MVRFTQVFLLAILWVSNYCRAASCNEEIDLPRLDAISDIAFVGTPIKKLMDFSWHQDKYLMEVIMVQKGSIPQRTTIWTKPPSECGATFTIGKKYVIFGKYEDKNLWTDSHSMWQLDSAAITTTTVQFFDFYRRH